MTQKSYNYENRQGILPISWEDFHGICKGLVKAIAPYDPEIILPIGRGGFYPGTMIAHMLRVEIYPVRLSRRINDVVRYKTPKWHIKPPEVVKNRRILVVDEICSSGETLLMVENKVENMGAKEFKSAVLYAHTWGISVPDYIGIISDALILNPWDREIFQNGAFQFHPEYLDALAKQGVKPVPSILINSPILEISKG